MSQFRELLSNLERNIIFSLQDESSAKAMTLRRSASCRIINQYIVHATCDRGNKRAGGKSIEHMCHTQYFFFFFSQSSFVSGNGRFAIRLCGGVSHFFRAYFVRVILDAKTDGIRDAIFFFDIWNCSHLYYRSSYFALIVINCTIYVLNGFH